MLACRGVEVLAVGGKVHLSSPVLQDAVQDHCVCTLGSMLSPDKGHKEHVLACMEEPVEPVFRLSTLGDAAWKVSPPLSCPQLPTPQEQIGDHDVTHYSPCPGALQMDLDVCARVRG